VGKSPMSKCRDRFENKRVMNYNIIKENMSSYTVSVYSPRAG